MVISILMALTAASTFLVGTRLWEAYPGYLTVMAVVGAADVIDLLITPVAEDRCGRRPMVLGFGMLCAAVAAYMLGWNILAAWPAGAWAIGFVLLNEWVAWQFLYSPKTHRLVLATFGALTRVFSVPEDTSPKLERCRTCRGRPSDGCCPECGGSGWVVKE